MAKAEYRQVSATSGRKTSLQNLEVSALNTREGNTLACIGYQLYKSLLSIDNLGAGIAHTYPISILRHGDKTHVAL